jgi:hypothetical protein
LPALSPDHLLEQADRLMAAPRRGPPRQADLRRAISNAYYAVFHAVVTAAADDFVGMTHRDTPRYELVYRGVDHGSLRRLCEDVIKTTLPSQVHQIQARWRLRSRLGCARERRSGFAGEATPGRLRSTFSGGGGGRSLRYLEGTGRSRPIQGRQPSAASGLSFVTRLSSEAILIHSGCS